VNTYTDEVEQKECKPCPEGMLLFVMCVYVDYVWKGQYSLPGSKQCSERPTCSANDYEAEYGECKNSMNLFFFFFFVNVLL
jgi:hypothetical protein